MVKLTFFIDTTPWGKKLTGHFTLEDFDLHEDDWFAMTEKEQEDWLSEKVDWFLKTRLTYGVNVSD